MYYRISDLKNFIEIATSRTMREGAIKLGITQPALSESIKRLEKDLNEVLFYRSRTGIVLTPGGQKCFEKAQNILTSLEDIGNLRSKNDSRLITIGCHPTIASYFLPKALQLIQNENPAYQIRLRHNLSRTIQLEVQQGQVDIALVVNAIPSPDLVIKSLASDEVCIWQNKSLKDSLPAKVFCNLALFQTQDILRKWKDKPSSLIDSDNLELITRFVNEGLGFGIVPARAISLLNAKNCERVPRTPAYQDTISLVHRPEFGRHPVEKAIIESLKRSVK